MRPYRVTISADKYPTEYTVEASGWPTAIARAVKEWKKRFKGSHTTQLNIRAVRLGQLLRENE